MAGILVWDKPKQVMSEEQRRREFSSDAEVHGTYQPNMSAEDQARWKAKLVGTRSNNPQVEIRKDTTVIVVSLLGGYNYKGYRPDAPGSDSSKDNLHIASAGPIRWTWEEYEQFQAAIAEAKTKLEEWFREHPKK
jgi:hypothetical protein